MSKQALEAKRRSVFLVPPEELTLITDPKDPLYDPRVEKPLLESFVLNIKKHGIRLNVRARKLGDKTIVVDGRRRVRAAIEANKLLKEEGGIPILVPVLTTHGEDKDLLNESIFLNEQRQDDDPFEKAEKARRLLSMGMDYADIAESFGVTTITVKNWLRLFELDHTVRNAVKVGQINVTSAIQLADLPLDKQKESLATLIQSGGATVAKANQIARGKTLAEKVSRPSMAQIRDVLETCKGTIPEECKAVLDWVVGNIQTSTAKKKLSWLKVSE